MKLTLALSAASIFVAQAASASTLDLTSNGFVSGFKYVDLVVPSVTVAGGSNDVPAGGFLMTDETVGGMGDFVAWCLDLGAYLGSGTNEYEMTDTPFQNGGISLMASGMARVAALFNANFGDSITASARNSAAFQVALWEVAYDDDFSIYSGDFQASGGNGVQNTATQYLTAAQNYVGPSLWDVSYLESTAERRRQHLVTVTEAPAPVPLPASGLMLLAAVGGIAIARRKKSA